MEITSTIPRYLLEFNNFAFQINVQLVNSTEEQEIIKQVKIIPQVSRETVVITEGQNSKIEGVYKNVFQLGPEAIKTVKRSDKQIQQYSSFDQIPKNKTEDIFKFKPPSSLDYPLSYTCKVIYDKKIIQTDDTGTSKETIQKDLTYEKTFSTVLKGSWDIWQKALKEYIKEYST